MQITRISPLSGKERTLDLPVTIADIINYEAGMCIQNAFPDLTPDQREFIKTGIYDGEWEQYIGKEE